MNRFFFFFLSPPVLLSPARGTAKARREELSLGPVTFHGPPSAVSRGELMLPSWIIRSAASFFNPEPSEQRWRRLTSVTAATQTG